MKFTVEREHLLKPLQQVSGPLGGRPTLPILGNLLLQVADGTLSLTGTDLEMEMVARVTLSQPHEAGATTVPARKFFDICSDCLKGQRLPCSWKATVCWCALAAAVSRSLRCLLLTSRTWTTGKVKSNSPCHRPP